MMTTYSLVIPAYNESHRLPAFLTTFAQDLKDSKIDLELIVIEDGSTLENVTIVDESLNQLAVQVPNLKIRHESLALNQGKGAAIACGLKLATNDIAGFLDADGSTSLQSWLEMATRIELEPTWACILGSRVKMVGRHVERSSLRHYVGRVFATYFSVLFGIPVYDSQCGAKVYRLSLVRNLFPLIRDTRFVWDTELLVLIHRARLPMIEQPVDWVEVGNNRISMWRDPAKMAWALLKFRLKI